MKRNYKMSSVILVLLIFGLISAIVQILFGENSLNLQQSPYTTTATSSFSVKTSIGYLLSSIISILSSFVISRGLIKNRMGTVGDYLNGVSDFSFKAFGIIFVVQIILTVVFGIIVAILAPMIALALEGNSDLNITMFIIIAIVSILLVTIISVFTYHAGFVAADDIEDVPFGELVSRTFRIGKETFGQTFKAYFKYVGIPLVIYLIITGFFLNEVLNGQPGFMLGLFLIVSFFLVIYLFFAGAMAYGKISDIYLDYKESHSNSIDDSLHIYE